MRLLLDKDKIILFYFIFKRVGFFIFYLGETDLLSLIFCSFVIGNFCCWANFLIVAYFVLNFRPIIFLWPLKGVKC